jgi:hypothetical protein
VVILLLIMSWTSHDSLMGWVHSFKLNRNNYILGGKTGINDKPYPVIVNKPTFPQVLNNWNRADTGLVLTFFLAGLLVAKRSLAKNILLISHVEKRSEYRRIHRVIVAFGFAMALRNSSYRLEGYVPNGLPRVEVDDVVKYDFTSELLNGTFWKYLFEAQAKPTAL